MSYSIIYNKEDGGVLTQYTGSLSDEELLKSAKERTQFVSKVKLYRYLLSDFTEVDDFNVTSEGIRATAEIAKKMLQINDRILVSVILPTDVKYGVGRIFQAYADEEDRWIKIARSMDEAVQWLNENLNA